MTQIRWAFVVAIMWTGIIALPALAHEQHAYADSEDMDDTLRANRFEFAIFPYDMTFRNTYVQHPYAAHAAIAYHIFDSLALEAFGGYAFVRGDSPTTTTIKAAASVPDFQLAALWRTKWFFGGNVLWAPLSGDMSFTRIFDTKYQIYVLLGAGLDGLERPDVAQTMHQLMRVSGNVGAGVRLFLSPSIALRAEIRENLGGAPLVAGGPTSGLQATTWCQLGVSIFL